MVDQPSQELDTGKRAALYQELAARSEEALCDRASLMLEACDDVFFDLSNRATSNTEQNYYFEAMREIREKATQVGATFHKALQHNFDRFRQPAAADTPDAPKERELALVQPEELEQNVAIAGIVSKARAARGDLLYAVGYRLHHLVDRPDGEFTETAHPLDPQAVCDAFAEAVRCLSLHSKARLVLFKQFDRTVVNALDDILERTNTLLRDNGIVPELPPRGSTPADARREPTPPPRHSHFNDLSRLLANLRAFGVSIPSAPRIAGVNTGPALQTDELVEALDRLPSSGNNGQWSGAKAIRNTVQHILSERSRDGHPVSLQRLDEDIINLVALFFDYVLDDEVIPTTVQLLISRLQLPALKAALSAPDFFDNEQHPARRCIEALAAVGQGCTSNPDDPDPLLDTLKASVDTLLQSDNTLEAFDTEARHLQQLLAQEKRKTAIIERRTSEAALGRARAEHARTQVQDFLYHRLRDRYLPRELLNFLVTTWRDVMFRVQLKYGVDSIEWEETRNLVDDILWSMEEVRDNRSSPSFQRLLPTLFNRIRKVSERAATPAADTARSLQAIEALYTTLTHTDQPGPAFEPLGPRHAEALGQSLANDLTAWDTEIATQREEAKYATLNFTYVQQADALEPGTWVLLHDTLQHRSRRAKLAAKISETDTYIFVDSNGFKLAEKPRRSVAYEMQRGRIKVLDSGPLFERAFQHISHNIRELTGEIAPEN